MGNGANIIDANNGLNSLIQNSSVMCCRLEQGMLFLQGIVANFNPGGQGANKDATLIAARLAVP